jgi:hypothetical protein
MGIRWPQLVQYLELNPEDLDVLIAREVPDGIDPDFAPVFQAPDAAGLATACNGVELTPDDVRLFSAPHTALERAPAQVPVAEFA